jgi:hypothetical protein
MANNLKNVFWIMISLCFPVILSSLLLILFIPGFFITFVPPYLIISLLVIYLTVKNVLNLDKAIFKRSPILKTFFLLFILTYSILSWYSFSIKEGKKQGFVSNINIPHEYSDRYWYFLNRTHPLFPFTYNGSAYIDINHNLSIPVGYLSLAKNKQGVGWHSIVSKKFYVVSLLTAFIYGFNIALFIIRKIKIERSR